MTGRNVTVLATHPASAPSMRRYGDLLAESYRLAGWTVRVMAPTDALSRLATDGSSVHKFIVYVEKLALFPLRIAARSGRNDLVHVTDHSDAPWLRSVRDRAPTVITCHDLIAIRAARGALEEHRPRWSGRLYQRYIASSLLRADIVTAVSRTTLEEVLEVFPSAPAQLLYNPLPPHVTRVTDAADPGIAGPFLLVVSIAGWRKRRHLAIAAWQRLRAQVEPALRLVFVGNPFTDDELALAGLDSMPEGTEVRSEIADAELAGLYSHAAGLLQLSSREGFGWPVIEANHWGTVVVSSELPVFHEVGPNNVFVGDRFDEVDWADVWSRLHDAELREQVRHDADRFSPEMFTRELNRIATTVIDSHSARRTTSTAHAPAPNDPETGLNTYFVERGAHRTGAITSVIRHPRAAIRAQRMIAGLQVVDAHLTTEGDAGLVRDGLRRTNGVARRLIRGTTALLVMPDTVEEYLAGRTESKRSLRTRFNRATRRGYRVRKPVDRDERRRLLAVADSYERSHPDDRYRNTEPNNEYLLDVDTWLVAEDGNGTPLVLAVSPISGEWAVLQHFKTLESSDAARLARYWLSVELVRELRRQGVRYLADTLSPIGLPNGLRDFQRRLGYRLHRVRLRR